MRWARSARVAFCSTCCAFARASMRFSRSIRSARSAATALRGSARRYRRASTLSVSMTPWPSATGASILLTRRRSGSTPDRYSLSSTGRTSRSTARIFFTRRRASWIDSSLSGSPIDLSSEVARSSCFRTIRRTSLEIACPDFRRNPTVVLLPLMAATELPDFQRARCHDGQQRANDGTDDPNLHGGQRRSSGDRAGRKEQRDREPAGCRQRDDDELAPVHVPRQVKTRGDGDADRDEHADWPADERSQEHAPRARVVVLQNHAGVDERKEKHDRLRDQV